MKWSMFSQSCETPGGQGEVVCGCFEQEEFLKNVCGGERTDYEPFPLLLEGVHLFVVEINWLNETNECIFRMTWNERHCDNERH